MSLYGSLATMPLPDLLQWVKTTQKSGNLYVQHAGQDYTLYLEQGLLMSFAARELSEELGRHLVSHGLVSLADIDRAYQLQREQGGSLAEVLVRGGFLAADVFEAYLREAALEMLYDLFLVPEGEFTLSDEQTSAPLGEGGGVWLSDDLRIPLGLDVENMTLEGMRRIDEWYRIKEVLPSIDATVTLDADKVRWERLGSRAHKVLSAVREGHPLSKICFDLRLSHFSVLRVLYEQHQAGALLVVRAEPAAIETRGVAPDNIDYILEQADTLLGLEQFDEALALYEVVLKLSPEHDAARRRLRKAREEQVAHLYQGFSPLKIPRLLMGREQLKTIRLSQEEQFLAASVDGQRDIGSLIMLSPLNERDTLRAIKKLAHIGVLEV